MIPPTPPSRQSCRPVGVVVVEDAAADLHVEEEDVVLEIRDPGVRLDDVGELSVADQRHFTGAQRELIPIAIAIAQSRELIDEDLLKRRPDIAAANVIFRKPADPQVDVVNAAVERLELGRHGRIGSDLAEGGDARQANGLARRVVIGQPVVASALDVERRQLAPSPAAAAASNRVQRAGAEPEVINCRIGPAHANVQATSLQ
jgi:hypothetical protein